MSRRRAPAPAVPRPPRTDRLPIGFAVELDTRVRRLNDGRALLGGAPLRLLRLSPTAVHLLGPGPLLRVRDVTTAALARRLLDTGVAHPRPAASGAAADVTVVVPVRDRPEGLHRLLSAVRRTAGPIPVLVVDDGSRDAQAVRRLCAEHSAILIRHDTPHGPAAARNAGLAAARTPYAALLDSDCTPLGGWLDLLRGHLDDPTVAAVAPRIVARPGRTGWLADYERADSALDLGPREGPVTPHGAIPYVPSVALLVRRAALGPGYDEEMRVAEDVDLVWRLVAAGWRVRYEPAALVAHDHRTTLGPWALRRAYYGTGAAPLAGRHGAAVAPIVVSPWSAAAWVALLSGHRRGPDAALVILAWAAYRLGTRLTEVEPGQALAFRLVGLGTAYAGRQLASALTRHYWPLSLIAGLISRRVRILIAVAAIADGLLAWWPRRHLLPFPRFLAARRLDDLCYGAGLWWGAAEQRSLAALRPEFRGG